MLGRGIGCLGRNNKIRNHVSDQEDADEVVAILKGHKKCEECKKHFPQEKMEEPFLSKEEYCKECYAKLYGCSIQPDEPWPRV